MLATLLKHSLPMLLLIFFSATAQAHKLAPSLLEISEQSAGHYQVKWRTPKLAKIQPKPIFPAPCQLGEGKTAPVGTAMEWYWQLHCPSGLGGKTIAIEHLASSRTAALLRFQRLDLPLLQQLLTSDQPSFEIPANSTGQGVVVQYLQLGAKHILIGIDHLFFVTGLLLLAGSALTLLKTVTAFTLGHSITLALVSLNIIPQWPALIELGIAATILVLAVELSSRQPRPSLLRRYQWPVAALFGLVHGLGFAGVLSELGLPKNDILPALFSFNIGIEIGQLLFVAALAAVYAAVKKLPQPSYPAVQKLTIYMMGSVSVFWCLERGNTLLQELF